MFKAAGLPFEDIESKIPDGEPLYAAIYECLQVKFAKPFFREILLSTGDKVLHERPLRGKGNEWTYPGEDALGKMLVRLRAEIR